MTMSRIGWIAGGTLVVPRSQAMDTMLVLMLPARSSIPFSLNENGMEDLAGNISTSIVSIAWERGTTNVPPAIQPILDMVITPDGSLRVKVKAADTNGDTLAYNLEFGPSTAHINLTNGVLSWAPTRTNASTTNIISLSVTDDGFPQMS